jgi:hypothetical protein
MSLSPSYLAITELPARPDPQTGEPRPPHAPASTSSGHPDKRDRIDPSKAPAPPDGQGPVLAWYKSSRRGAFKVAAVALLLLFPVMITIMQGFSIAWMRIWQVWLVIVIGCVLIYSARRSVECSSGADWLRRKKGWVKLYQLTKVTAHWRSNAVHLDLKDRDNRELQIRVSDIQENRLMWDLVYNGILHSVIAGGAETNGRLHAAIQVPRPYPERD